MTELLNEIYATTISLRNQPGPKNEKNEAREARQNEWIAAGGTLYRMASILKNPGREMLQKVLFDREVITHVIQDIKIRNLWLSGATGKERNNNAKQTNKTLTKTITEDQFMDIIFLVWLDGVHDEYVKQTFYQWTNGGFFKKYFGGKRELTDAVNKIVKNWFNKPSQGGTVFMKALFNSMKSKLQHQKRFMENTLSKEEKFAPIGSAWESLIKWDIGTIFNYSPPRKLKRNQFLSKTLKPTNTKVPVLYVSVDAEERDDKPLSRLVDNSRKVMNNLVTPGTLLDPGNTMILEGINTDIGQMVEHHFGSGGSFNLRNSYYIGPMTLDMKLGTTGQSVFKLELKVNRGIAQSGKHSMGSFFTQELNGESIPNVASAKTVAQKGKGGDQVNAAASKWSGDGLQYIYQAFIGAVNPNPGAVRYPFGSQDGMADCCFCKWSELVGETKPIVFVDWGLATGKSGSMVIQAYNLPETLKTRQLVASEISLRGPETIQGTPILFTPVVSVADRGKDFNRVVARLKAAYGNNANMNAEIDSIFSAGDFLAPLSMDYKKILHRLRTLDGESFANNVGKNEYRRKIFDEFKSKFYDYIFVDNNELMDKINSKITNLNNMVTKGTNYVETNLNRATFQNYSSLINRISKKLIMNGAKKDQVVMMADRAKKFKLSDSNKKQILNLLKTTTNTPGVINVLKQINKMNKKTDGGTGSQGTARTPSGQLISTPGNGLKANATSAKREAPAPVPAKIRAKMLSARVNAEAVAQVRRAIQKEANAQREPKRQKIGNQ